MNYIIEHSSRGVYVGMLSTGKPQFKYSILRSDGKVFHTEEAAREQLSLIRRQRGCHGVYIFSWDPKSSGHGKYIYPKHIV